MNDNKNTATSELSFDDRKKALITQGATRRREADRSIDIVRSNLHVDRLAKSAVTHLTSAASEKFEHMLHNRGITVGNVGSNLKRYLPLAATAYSIIKRRNLAMPLLKGGGVLAAVSYAAYLIWQRKQSRVETYQAMSDYPDYLGEEPRRF